MPDTPTAWELSRAIDRIREDLKAAVDRAEHHITDTGLAPLLGRIDDQIRGLGDDIAQERAMRKADIESERDTRRTETRELKDQLAAMVRTQRYVATTILLPVALFVANLVFLFARS